MRTSALATALVLGARAASGQVGVSTEACNALDEAKLRELIAVELAHIDPSLKLGVRVACNEASAAVAIRSAATLQSGERTIAFDRLAERERVVALAAHELFVAIFEAPRSVPASG